MKTPDQLPQRAHINQFADPELSAPSLARNSLYRLTADATSIVLGLFAATITARFLGPADKGTYSSILYLMTLCATVASLGLADSTIILVGQKLYGFTDAIRNSIPILLISTTLGGALLGLLGYLQLEGTPGVPISALYVAIVTLPLTTMSTSLASMLHSREKILFSSVVLIITSLISGITLFLLVVVWDTGIVGALGATAISSGVGLAIVLGYMRQIGLSLKPRLDLGYAKKAVRHGFAIQGSAIMMNLTARVDLLILYGMVGRSAAGQYSISLTVGQLVIYAPFAISLATYPRIANVEKEEADFIARQTFRAGAAAAILVAAGLAIAAPFIIPALFGRAFEPAVGPSLLLLVGGVLWSDQWLLCRAETARGNTAITMGSFTTSAVVMVLGDFVLIPSLGTNGAALASIVGALAGLLVVLVWRRRSGSADSFLDLIPRPSDFRAVIATPSRLLLAPRHPRTKRLRK